MQARALVVFETAWDRRQLEACRPAWEERYRVEFAEPSDAETPWELDVIAWIEREAAARRGRVDGVLSSSDYPGATVAGALAAALGTPGTPPERLLCAAHKYYSRLAQAECVPDAVPPFDLIDPERPESWAPATGFPCFVKPVKGAFSVLARAVQDRAELEAFLRSPSVRAFLDSWMGLFDQLVARYARFEHGGRRFIAEGLLGGELATVEGYCRGGAVHLLGIVDSRLHAGTRSFAGFEYPSRLPEAVQVRMQDVVRRLIGHLGLTDVVFNVELVWDPRDDGVRVLEVNPRMAGQFADLHQMVDGVNTYEIALALATGREPPERRGGAHALATSVPLRVFRPTLVRRAPTPADVAAAEELSPGTHVWIECAEGDALADFDTFEDGASLRYAVVNLGADSRELAARGVEAVVQRLGFALEPTGAPRP